MIKFYTFTIGVIASTQPARPYSLLTFAMLKS